MAPKTVLFDLDGTVWDSQPFYAMVLSALSGRPASQLAPAVSGNVMRLVRKLRIPREEFFSEARRRGAMLELYDNVNETLRGLRRQGVSMGVATSLPGPLVNVMLAAKRLSEFFEVVVAFEVGLPAKPNPAPLLACLTRMGKDATHDVVYVGDRDVDRQAAYAAGVRFAWASYGYGTPGESSDDEIQINRFDALLNL